MGKKAIRQKSSNQNGNPSPMWDKFSQLLKKYLKADSPDLDFGIYRLLRQSQDHLDSFLTEKFPQSIHETIQNVPPQWKSHLEQIEIVMSNHLIQFFSRFYERGDFVPNLVLGASAPYFFPIGTDTAHFHWANAHQYFVKSDRFISRYAFVWNQFRVELVLHNAVPSINNIKNDNCFFILPESQDPAHWDASTKHLSIKLHFRLIQKEEQEIILQRLKLQKIISQTSKSLTQSAILMDIQESIRSWISNKAELQDFRSMFVETSKIGSPFLKYLRLFTQQSYQDYFIHQDLTKFLVEQAHFYALQEILTSPHRLSELNPENGIDLVYATVFERLVQPIAEFLGTWENLRKKLWEKKKWIYDVQYCFSLAMIPPELYSVIEENHLQQSEWQKLYGLNINSIKIDARFVQEHHNLMIDTKYFSSHFKADVLSTIENIDDTLEGILIKSDNYQGLRILEHKLAGQINTLYIDPPYNTGGDEFVYKDNYNHSCWLSFLAQTFRAYQNLCQRGSLYFISIDDNELSRISLLIQSLFGQNALGGHIIVRSNPIGRTYLEIQQNHEYIVFGKFKPLLKKPAHRLPIGTLWDEKDMRTENGTRLLNQMFDYVPIQHPKPIELIKKCIQVNPTPTGWVLDYFGGSGSTAHATMDLNYQDGGNRQFCLIEMADYFETLIIPRIKKVCYSRYWNEGVPSERKERIPISKHCFKYFRLEQYEDSLNNCQVVTKISDKSQIDKPHLNSISYRIDLSDSRVSLSIENLVTADPFDIKLSISVEGVMKETGIDVVETFNFLLGIHVKSHRVRETRQGRYLIITGIKSEKNCIILWRNLAVSNFSLDLDSTIIEEIITPYGKNVILYVNGACKHPLAQDSIKKLVERMTE